MNDPWRLFYRLSQRCPDLLQTDKEKPPLAGDASITHFCVVKGREAAGKNILRLARQLVDNEKHFFSLVPAECPPDINGKLIIIGKNVLSGYAHRATGHAYVDHSNQKNNSGTRGRPLAPCALQRLNANAPKTLSDLAPRKVFGVAIALRLDAQPNVSALKGRTKNHKVGSHLMSSCFRAGGIYKMPIISGMESITGMSKTQPQ
jgi:hypothetical protein